jgi:multiple sugar transport system substrate-binding protein
MTEFRVSMIIEPAPSQILFQQLMQEFTARYGIQVETTFMTWDNARSQLVDYALDRNSPDLSEIGSSWLSSFVSMNALRPFTDRDLHQLEVPSPFIPASQATVFLTGTQLWAIPWTADTRLIFYRRDLLEAAGIEAETAFQTVANMQQTLNQLRAHGGAIPWCMDTTGSNISIHDAASWVWAAGGSFISPDGHQTHFNDPESRAGLQSYFSNFGPHIIPSVQNLTNIESNTLFLNGELAATLTGHWVYNTIASDPQSKLSIDMIGTAPPSAVPFVGGSHMVVWKHCRRPDIALKLLQFLSSHEVHHTFLPEIGQLSPRSDVWQTSTVPSNSHYQNIKHNLLNGRSFRASYMWGMVEDRLAEAIGTLWRSYFKDPNLDLAQAIAKKLALLARQLDRTLSAR